MKVCTWSRGCSVTVLGDDEHCTYHAKAIAGLIQTTRGEGKEIVPVAMTPAERERAERARSDDARRRGPWGKGRGPAP